jgi:hypothetical protein
MGRVFSRIVMLMFIAATVAGAMNVYSNVDPIVSMARALACRQTNAEGAAADRCGAQLTQISRTPFFQDVRFQTRRRVLNVRCARAFYLVGDYGCVISP